MFRHCMRLQLRRGVHSRSNSSLGSQPFKYRHPAYVVGASLTMVTYLAWVWNSNPRHVWLDSEPVHKDSKIRPPPSKRGPSLSSEQVLCIPPDAQDKGENQEDSSDGQGAFNPETGEINWDCPCLGGMAHGPSFSCFVYSDKEPKGIDCVEKFKAMQDCFRAHPDVYGEEILDDEDENAETTSEASIQSDHAPPTNPP
ncbi:hypothetical protein BKA83DRAFT_4280475, partial [Pisolithus microcarpus]